MKFANLWIVALAVGFFANGCASTGPVSTQLSDAKQPVISPPLNYQSPLEEIRRLKKEADRARDKLVRPIDFQGKDWRRYVGWQQAYETALADQQKLEEELSQKAAVRLKRGKSYHFKLETFCVHAGKHRPVEGDGFRFGPLKGRAKGWLPKILREYRSKGVSQDEAQSLIWSFLTGAKYDDLTINQKTAVRKIYPDAPLRFGNRFLENEAKNFFQKLIPDEAKRIQRQYEELRSVVTDHQRSFQDVARILAPIPTRKDPISIGWVRMPEGYLLKAVGIESFQEISVEIYVPMELAKDPFFQPDELVAVPANGQRLAVSPFPVRDPSLRKPRWTCDQVKTWKSKSCRPMTSEKRVEILKLADPTNFKRTRYQSPPEINKPIEVETDCSVFTFEIYARAGFEYPMSTTSALDCVPTFKIVPMERALPGDLILFDHHVGILDSNGQVISATRGGSREQSKLNPDDPGFLPAITRYPQRTFGKGRVLQWECP